MLLKLLSRYLTETVINYQFIIESAKEYKWGLAPSPNCECGASEQTADHVLTACPIHRAAHGARGLTVSDDETRCWLNGITASI